MKYCFLCIAVSLDATKRKLAEAEALDAAAGRSLPNKLHPSSFVRMGLEIEDQQYVVQFTQRTIHSSISSRQQILEHLRSNRQRTDPQKIEIQQRRNALTKRITVWRVAQAVYMPQTPAYLPDEHGLLASNETEVLDSSKPETWPLFLPSAIPKDDRSACYKGIIETERTLRLAQLQDSLVNLRRFRRSLRNLRLYFKTNIAGEGRKTQTKSRTIETGVNNRIKRAVWRYRVAYCALLELDAGGDWKNEYRELKDEDNRGPLKEIEEMGVGDGRYAPSWIWAAPSSMALPGEGSAAERQEVNETVRYEWMTCRARADRWVEEEELLQEEMRRVVVYLEWKSHSWFEKIGVRAGSCSPDIQHGIDAYARKQANIHHEIAVSFSGRWLPYLKACGLDTGWTKAFLWLSQAPHQTKLPNRSSAVPGDDPCTLPSTGLSPGTERGREGGDGRSKHSNDNSGDCDEGEQDSDNEESDNEEDDEGGDSNDGAESGDEIGFEYDDEYMS